MHFQRFCLLLETIDLNLANFVLAVKLKINPEQMMTDFFKAQKTCNFVN